MNTPQAYPLQWPANFPRHTGSRETARFKTELGSALRNLTKQLELMGTKGLILSSNCTLGQSNATDPGVCAYFIIGGESGHGARPCNVEWVRSLVRQGREAGTATFVKQWGAKPSTPKADPRAVKSVMGATECYNILKLTHPKGGDPAEWPEDMRVREYPEGLR